MGYIAHDAAIAVVDEPDLIAAIETFRAAMPADYRQYLVGPVVGINGYHAYAFLPDGSKEGWAYSNEVGTHRRAFAELVERDVVLVRFGGDFGSEIGTRIIATSDPIVSSVHGRPR